MQKRTLVYTLTLATITAAGLGSAAMADRMGGGHGMPGMMGMMGGGDGQGHGGEAQTVVRGRSG